MENGFWWVEYKENGTPFTPCKKPIFSETKPEGNYCGGFHCFDCAIDCVSFGATPEKAYEANHGIDDRKFCTWLGDG